MQRLYRRFKVRGAADCWWDWSGGTAWSCDGADCEWEHWQWVCSHISAWAEACPVLFIVHTWKLHVRQCFSAGLNRRVHLLCTLTPLLLSPSTYYICVTSNYLLRWVEQISEKIEIDAALTSLSQTVCRKAFLSLGQTRVNPLHHICRAPVGHMAGDVFR